MLPKLLTQWLDTAAAQLRCRRAVPGVREELESHVAEQYHALRQAGKDEETAAGETAQSMGDAVQVGVSLDAVHRPRPAWGAVAALGAVMLLARLLWILAGRTGNSVLSVVPALLILLGTAYWADISRLARHGTALYLLYSAVLLCLPFAGFPRMISGRIQYAEALCMLLVPLYALAVYSWKDRGLWGMLACVALLLPGMLACLAMPLMAGCMELALTALALGIYCCAKDWFGLGRKTGFALLGGAVVLLTAAVFLLLWRGGHLTPHYFDTLRRYFTSGKPNQSGYFSLLKRDVLAGGDGLGATPEQLASLLADFPLTYWFYRLGSWAVWLALGALAGAIALLCHCALRVKNAAGRLAALACAVLTAVQIGCNLLAGAGLLNLTVSLPFLGSASACCAQAVLAGLLLSAFRYDAVCPPLPSGRAGKKRLIIEWR